MCTNAATPPRVWEVMIKTHSFTTNCLLYWDPFSWAFKSGRKFRKFTHHFVRLLGHVHLVIVTRFLNSFPFESIKKRNSVPIILACNIYVHNICWSLCVCVWVESVVLCCWSLKEKLLFCKNNYGNIKKTVMTAAGGNARVYWKRAHLIMPKRRILMSSGRLFRRLG